MPLRKLASTSAHKLLAKLIDLGIVPPAEPGGITAAARCEDVGLQVVITIASYAPLRISPETLARIDALGAVIPPAPPPIELNELQGQIALALSVDRPIKVETLWVRLGKDKPGVEISGYFKTTCKNLTRMGIAKNVRGHGYQLCAGVTVRTEGDKVRAYKPA